MNWGQKLAAVYLSFVAFMACLVWLCVKQDDIHLVSQDYYRQEIAYQEKIDSRSNARQLSANLRFEQDKAANQLKVTFPQEVTGAEGQIQFYRPSDARKDLVRKLETNTGNTQTIDLKGMDKGLWVLKTTWKKDGKSFYQEDKLVLGE